MTHTYTYSHQHALARAHTQTSTINRHSLRIVCLSFKLLQVQFGKQHSDETVKDSARNVPTGPSVPAPSATDEGQSETEKTLNEMSKEVCGDKSFSFFFKHNVFIGGRKF